ncbi:MAG TPA: hypothetical protein VI233_00330, partial [Puia sp.]
GWLGMVLAALVCRGQGPAAGSGAERAGYGVQQTGGGVVGARLDTVSATGFYSVILPPELVARCKEDLSDLRLYRSNHDIAPYVLLKNFPDTGYLPLPDPKIRQKDSSNKHSYISLQYADSYRIGQLSFVIGNPSLYKRSAQVINPDDSTGVPLVVSITMDPNNTVFRIPAVKTRRLLIDIGNADNAPLRIIRVASGQSKLSILVHLEKGVEYELEGGNPLATKPDYDLHYFTDSLRQPPVHVGLGPLYNKVQATPGDSRASKPAGSASGNTRSGLLLWSVIVLVLLLLVYLSVKMVKAIAKKEIDDRL